MRAPKPTEFKLGIAADLHKWRTFVAIAELGSLTRAALFLDSNLVNNGYLLGLYAFLGSGVTFTNGLCFAEHTANAPRGVDCATGD